MMRPEGMYEDEGDENDKPGEEEDSEEEVESHDDHFVDPTKLFDEVSLVNS